MKAPLLKNRRLLRYGAVLPVFSAFLILLTGYFIKTTPSVNIPEVIFSEANTPINDWLVIGPIDEPNPVNAMVDDHLTELGISESLAVETWRSRVSRYRVRRALYGKIGRATGSPLQFRSYFQFKGLAQAQFKVYYAISAIKSSCSRPFTMLVGNNGITNIFINGKRIDNFTRNRDVLTPTYIVEGSLNPGDNVILVKCYSGKTGDASVRIIPDTLDRCLYRSAVASELIINPVIAIGNRAPSLWLNNGTRPESEYDIEIVQPEKQKQILVRRVKDREPIIPAGQQLDYGIYQARIRFGNEILRQDFVIGTIDDIRRRIMVQKDKLTPQQAEALAPYAVRCDALLKPDAIKERDINWQVKVLNCVIDAESILTQNISSISWAPKGLHFKAFTSRIDGQMQAYRYFYPSRVVENRPVPLFVILPAVLSIQRPFLLSPFAAAHLEAIKLSKLAEDLGIAILWPGYRTPPYGCQPCDLTHFDEVLNHFERTLAVDPARISLLATCSGGKMAGMLIANWPRRFASAAFYDAVFRLGQNSNGLHDLSTFQCFPAYKQWIQKIEPFERLIALGRESPPLFVFHSNKIHPGHGDLALSEEFVEAARKADMPITFLKAGEDTGTDDNGRWATLFDFCARQRRDSTDPASPGLLYKDHNQIGPISSAFAEQFLVVVGTGGSEEEINAGKRIASKFLSEWESYHFSPCTKKLDTDVNKIDLDSSNLVLIGNAKNNLVWREYASRIPVKITGDEIEIDGRKFVGDKLGLQAIVINPYNKNRKIVLIGGDSIAMLDFSVLNLSVDGWYDYSIWKENEPIAFKHYTDK